MMEGFHEILRRDRIEDRYGCVAFNKHPEKASEIEEPGQLPEPKMPEQLGNINFTASDTETILKNLDPSKAEDPDSISP